jgi:NitT/TauT family transport system substrate-binding protein
MKSARMTRRAALAAGTIALMPHVLIAQELKTIIVGGVTVEDSLPVWVAMNNGMFRRAGINIDFQPVASGSAAAVGIAGGAFNIGNTNTLALTLAHARGVAMSTVAFSGMFTGTDNYIGPIVKKDSPLQTAADLRGKLHGTTGVKDLNSLAMSTWLDKNGGDASSLRVVEVPYPAIGPAVEEGRVDVGTLIQPFLGNALATGKTRFFANTYAAIAPKFALSSWTTMAPWGEANADTVRRFARVMREAMVYCNSHQRETIPLLVQYTKVDPDAVAKGGRASFTETFAEPNTLQPLIDVAAKYGAIEKRFSASDLMSPAIRGLR